MRASCVHHSQNSGGDEWWSVALIAVAISNSRMLNLWPFSWGFMTNHSWFTVAIRPSFQHEWYCCCWWLQTPLPINTGSGSDARFADDLYAIGLCQINNIRHSTGRFLDLIFCSEANNVKVCKIPHSHPLKHENQHPYATEIHFGRSFTRITWYVYKLCWLFSKRLRWKHFFSYFSSYYFESKIQY